MLARLAFVLSLVVIAPLARAEIYKWVDDNGVTNYSNTPPASRKATTRIQAVEERISVIPSAQGAPPPTDIYRRLAALDQEWLQRQRLMAAAASYGPPACASPLQSHCLYDGYRVGSYYGPFVPLVAVRTVPLRRSTLRPGRAAMHPGSPR
jgi:Domain of unknown function (DUF4124)